MKLQVKLGQLSNTCVTNLINALAKLTCVQEDHHSKLKTLQTSIVLNLQRCANCDLPPLMGL